jgi:hypothetical protein
MLGKLFLPTAFSAGLPVLFCLSCLKKIIQTHGEHQMLAIPPARQAQYTDFLKNGMDLSNEHSSYLKWLRF